MDGTLETKGSCCGQHAGFSLLNSSHQNLSKTLGIAWVPTWSEGSDWGQRDGGDKGRTKQTEGTLYLAVELSPSVSLSWIIVVWQRVSCRAEVAGMHDSPSPSPPPHQHLQQSCKVPERLLQGCVTRAVRITPWTHYQRGGLLRVDRKYRGEFSNPVLLCCQQVNCAKAERCIHVLDVNDAHVSTRKTSNTWLLHRWVLVPVLVSFGSTTLMALSSRWFVVFKAPLVIKYIPVAAHPAFPTFIWRRLSKQSKKLVRMCLDDVWWPFHAREWGWYLSSWSGLLTKGHRWASGLLIADTVRP